MLVDPKCTVHIVEGKAGLAELTEKLELHWQLAGNLRQLCGWDIVGDDRICRKIAEGWTLLEHVKWMQRRGSSTLLPVFGTAPTICTNHSCFQADGVNELALKKLLNGLKKQAGVWSCLNPGKVPPPPFVQNIQDGESLCGRTTNGVIEGVPPQQASREVDVAAAGGGSSSRDARGLSFGSYGASLGAFEPHAREGELCLSHRPDPSTWRRELTDRPSHSPLRWQTSRRRVAVRRRATLAA